MTRRFHLYRGAAVLCLCLLISAALRAQIYINEVSTQGELLDENAKERDWIELFNAGTSPVDLGSLYLSDELVDLDKWRLPEQTLGPEQFITILASGKDRRQFVDHYEGVVSDAMIWRYFGASEPPADWYEPGFDDASWLSGPGGFGYGDGDDATVIPSIPSVYLRHTFTITDTSDIGSVAIHIDFDDGCVAYLNGVEVFRENLTGLPPLYDAEADEAREVSIH